MISSRQFVYPRRTSNQEAVRRNSIEASYSLAMLPVAFLFRYMPLVTLAHETMFQCLMALHLQTPNAAVSYISHPRIFLILLYNSSLMMQVSLQLLPYLLSFLQQLQPKNTSSRIPGHGTAAILDMVCISSNSPSQSTDVQAS